MVLREAGQRGRCSAAPTSADLWKSPSQWDALAMLSEFLVIMNILQRGF